MARDWQAPYRVLYDQFLSASEEPQQIKLALATFPDHRSYAMWYERTIKSDVWQLVLRGMTKSFGGARNASAEGTIRGEAESVRRFTTLAKEAGRCLPLDFYPGDRIFPSINEPANLNPDPLTLWSEFLFVSRFGHFRLREGWPTPGCRTATLDGNPFLASATAIAEFILSPTAPDLDTYFQRMRTVCPWMPNLAGGFPMTPHGIVTPPDIRPDPAEVLRRALELEAALVARDAAGASGKGGRAEWVTGFLADLDADRAVHVAAERLLSGVNPRLARVEDWSRQLDFTSATADARQALRTLGLAVADIRGDVSARGRELLAAGARHLWVGMTAGDRAAARELVPVAVLAWGWPANFAEGPAAYDGPRATLADPRVIDHQWRTRGPEYLGQLQIAVGGMNFLVDSIRLPGGGRFDIYRDDVKASRASLPSVCPGAEPKPPEELRPPGELLADIEFRFRSLGLVRRDESIHWVGRQQRRETWCHCELAPAALARPRPPVWDTLRDLRTAMVAMTELVWRYAEGPGRGEVFRDEDRRAFDHLAERVYGLAQSLDLPLPPPVTDARGRSHGPTSLPVVERPDGLVLSEADIALWLATWRGERVGVEARLAQQDRQLQPDGNPDDIDTRDHPLDAPAGTPSPLVEAFEAVSRALFDTAAFRREAWSGGLVFRELAESLATRIRAAERLYGNAELLLQAVADEQGCAHRDALAAIRRVNDAVGHVMLGIVPDRVAVSHVRQVPAPDLPGLLQRMRRQVSRAAGAVNGRPGPDSPPQQEVVGVPARVRCDPTDRSVYLDGKQLAGELPTPVFHFFRVIADRYPNPIRFREMQGLAPGLRGKHPTRTKKRLPRALERLVGSDASGYVLKLPAPK